MTPAELEQAAREGYNAVGETFWSQSEIFSLIYAACLELAMETKCIERTYETTTVAGTAEYAYPTGVISIKRATYDGIKLSPINQRQADSLALNGSSTSITGTPQYYSEWNSAVTLFVTPDDAKTLKLYTFNEPQVITNTSVLEIPSVFHMRLLNSIHAAMYAKDKDFGTAKGYKELWIKDIQEIKRWVQRRRRGDSFASVLDEDSLPNTIIGFS